MEIKCNCGELIGVIVEVEGQERLMVGNLILNVARGVCASCGTEFHWSISERMLAELIQHVIQMRENAKGE